MNLTHAIRNAIAGYLLSVPVHTWFTPDAADRLSDEEYERAEHLVQSMLDTCTTLLRSDVARDRADVPCTSTPLQVLAHCYAYALSEATPYAVADQLDHAYLRIDTEIRRAFGMEVSR